MTKWKASDIEKITKTKLKPHPKKGLIPKPIPAGVQFIKNHLTLLKLEYIQELVFSKKRKFRFDIAIPNLKIAIEYEGLNSAKSGHTTMSGYTSDCTKYNLAQKEGWIVLRYTLINYKDFPIDLRELQTQKPLKTN